MTDQQNVADTAPATTCTSCHREYDPGDPAAVEYHTVPIKDCVCNRCRGKPGCYMCGADFCKCRGH